MLTHRSYAWFEGRQLLSTPLTWVSDNEGDDAEEIDEIDHVKN